MLFNLVLKKVKQEMNILEEVILGQIIIKHLVYVDNNVLFAEDLDMVKHLGNKLINTTKKSSPNHK